MKVKPSIKPVGFLFLLLIMASSYACGDHARKVRGKLNREMKMLSQYTRDQKILELKEGVIELNTRLIESRSSIASLEIAVLHLTSKTKNLEAEYGSIRSLVKNSGKK